MLLNRRILGNIYADTDWIVIGQWYQPAYISVGLSFLCCLNIIERVCVPPYRKQILTNKQDKHREGSHFQRGGLWQTLQFGPHLLQNIQHLFFHIHSDSQMQVPQGDMTKCLRLCF